MTVAHRLMMGACGGAGGDAPFFGEITMLREFWVEDPAYSNPGDGNAETGTIPDNGTAAADASVPAGAGSIVYRESDLGGRPAWDFSGTTTKGFKTTSTSAGTDFTVFLVVQLDSVAVDHTLCDAGTGNQAVVNSNIGPSWQMFNTGGLNQSGGTPDTSPHLLLAHFKSGGSTFYVDGTSTFTSSATVAAATGFVIGSNFAVSGGSVTGSIAYAGMYSGDLTTDGGYSDWASAVTAYYGI